MAGLRIMLMGNEAAQAKMAAMPQKLSAAMDKAMGRALNVIYRKAVNHLTGGNPLHVQTGRLRQSIATFQKISDHSGGIGTNVEYAAAHEYGFMGEIQVPAHAQRARQMFGPRKSKGGGGRIVQVRSYSRQMNLPERPYLRPALAESQTEIVEIFRSGLAAFLAAK